MSTLHGQLVDIHARRIFPAEVAFEGGVVVGIREVERAPERYLIPGFVDAHVHIESAMLPPAEFGRLAMPHGTVATVSDPHEIANVLGVEGVRWMIAEGKRTPLKIAWGASPCVPATDFETAGAAMGIDEVASLLREPEVKYLSEVMNFPAVLAGDPRLMAMIQAAQVVGKPVDGHAPGLRGEEAAAYAAAGIQTDHECFTLEEALDKLAAGMWILIREGSAARNFNALAPLLRTHPDRCMFCTDDAHPNTLRDGHVDRIVAKAVASGADIFDVLRCASLHPVAHYQLPVGLLRVGDPADVVVVENLNNFRVLETYIDGRLVAKDGMALLDPVEVSTPNQFRSIHVQVDDLRVPCKAETASLNVIRAMDGQLVTQALVDRVSAHHGELVSDPAEDLLKLVVVNRYDAAPPAVAFIRGFGLQRGALASSVAHDSHNIVAVGVCDRDLAHAINLVASQGGGVCAVHEQAYRLLELPIAGLMSDRCGSEVAHLYEAVDRMAKDLGSGLSAPLMTLSFMALLVIPELKLSDRGLFSGTVFDFVPVWTA